MTFFRVTKEHLSRSPALLKKIGNGDESDVAVALGESWVRINKNAFHKMNFFGFSKEHINRSPTQMKRQAQPYCITFKCWFDIEIHTIKKCLKM